MHFKVKVFVLQSKDNSKFGVEDEGQQGLLFKTSVLGPEEENTVTAGEITLVLI